MTLTRDPGPGAATVTQLTGQFTPISLADTQGAALMNRMERKYLTSLGGLCGILPLLIPHYRAMDIAGERLQRYLSVYLDTPDFAMYLAHHNGRPRRHKVRTRQYLQTGQTYLELKLRDVTGRTRKERTLLSDAAGPVPADPPGFMGTHLPQLARAELRPTLTVECERLTLVHPHRRERLTFDLHLNLTGPHGQCGLDSLVVIELKWDGHGPSLFAGVARQCGLRDQPFSKYGVGCALLYPHLKHHTFKPTLRRLGRLTEVRRAPTAPDWPAPTPSTRRWSAPAAQDRA